MEKEIEILVDFKGGSLFKAPVKQKDGRYLFNDGTLWWICQCCLKMYKTERGYLNHIYNQRCEDFVTYR